MVKVLVIGHKGEVGSALYELAKSVHDVQGLDPKAPEETIGDAKFDVIQIAMPYGPDFMFWVKYFATGLFQRSDTLIIVESTVPPGTIRKLTDEVGRHFVHSPVRGLHKSMKRDLLRFVKYVASYDQECTGRAIAYYQTLGMEARAMRSPLETEYAKLFSLAYYGALIALHQTFYEICRNENVSYWDAVLEFSETYRLGYEYKWPRPLFFPDVIDGHCVLPAIKMLKDTTQNPRLYDFMHAIEQVDAEHREFVKKIPFHVNDMEAMRRHIENSFPDY